MIKHCERCGVDTPRGTRGHCKPCQNARMKRHRALENKDVRRAYSAAWIAKPGNKDLAKATQVKRRSTPRGSAAVLFQRARRRAKDSGLPFSLNFSHVHQVIERGVCEVSGLPFVLKDFGSPYRPSIDQIRAGEGYTPQNTRIILWGINVACHTWGLEAITEIFRSVP
jgi:hypothetical protein